MDASQAKPKKRKTIRVGYNVYTATFSLGSPIISGEVSCSQDGFLGRVSTTWSETVDNGLIGMKKAEN